MGGSLAWAMGWAWTPENGRSTRSRPFAERLQCEFVSLSHRTRQFVERLGAQVIAQVRELYRARELAARSLHAGDVVSIRLHRCLASQYDNSIDHFAGEVGSFQFPHVGVGVFQCIVQPRHSLFFVGIYEVDDAAKMLHVGRAGQFFNLPRVCFARDGFGLSTDSHARILAW